MLQQYDSLTIKTSFFTFKDIFSEYFSDNSEWEIKTLNDLYVSVNKRVAKHKFIIYNVKDSKDISHKVIDFEMVFGETYNLFFTNPPKANQREILRTIVLEIKDKIEKWKD